MDFRKGDAEDSASSRDAPAVRERDGGGGSLSSSAPSAFSGFTQFQQQQQEEQQNRGNGSPKHLDNFGSSQFVGSDNGQTQHEPLSGRLNVFRLRDVGCDVAFVVGEENEQLKAHKLVLGASSTVFHAMFYGPMASAGLALSAIQPQNSLSNNIAGGHGQSVAAAKGTTDNAPSRTISAQSHHNHAGNEQQEDGEEYDEEYEDEEYEEEEVDNLSHGSSLSNSVTSSMEGEPPSQQQMDHRVTDATKEVNNHQRFPMIGGGSRQHRFALKLKLAQKTVQAAEHNDFLDKSLLELANHGSQIVRVPDCEPKAFAILIDFVYSDFDVNSLSNRRLLNDENVMNTLYAAKKYDIHPLVTECVRYCTARLTATNAVSLLAQARLLDENTLVKQCNQVIDQNTDIALGAENVADIDRNTLIDVLGRSQLDPSSELVIFYAAKAWAEAECSRRNIPPNVENLRQCLGPAMQLIRFSLMDVNEFGQAASSNLLSCEEIAEVFLHLTVRPRPPCRFAAQGFRAHSRSKHFVQRFLSVSAKPRSRREHKVCFTTDRDILVSGLSVYGVFQASNKCYDENPKTTWEHDVEIKLETSTDSPSIYGSALKQLSSNIVQLSGKFGDPIPLVAFFTEPVHCQANVTYLATVHFKNETGVSTFQGKDGQDLVTVELPFDQAVIFKFQSYRYGFGNEDGGRAEGQIPAIHFLIQWPDNPTSPPAEH